MAWLIGYIVYNHVTTKVFQRMPFSTLNAKVFSLKCFAIYGIIGQLSIRVETGSGHPGQPGHILSGSSGPDPLYKISRSDPNSTLYHVR